MWGFVGAGNFFLGGLVVVCCFLYGFIFVIVLVDCVFGRKGGFNLK